MNKKSYNKMISLSFCALLISSVSFAQTKTTTIEEETTEVQSTTKVPVKKTKSTVEPFTTSSSNTTSSTSTTVEVEQPRKVYSEDTLKKISNTLCTDGFKAYVGSDKKNICQSRVTPPDIAYTCVWDKKGTMAFAPSVQGPCSLDYTEHKGSLVITKDAYRSKPPLSYGVEAQCCYRAAKGPMASN